MSSTNIVLMNTDDSFDEATHDSLHNHISNEKTLVAEQTTILDKITSHKHIGLVKQHIIGKHTSQQIIFVMN